MINLNSKSFLYGKNILTLETGEISRNSTSILAKMNETMILVSLVKGSKVNKDFLPLTVNYYEKSYSAGKIPGGFLKREIKQSENEIIISRLIDRSIRPLFDKNYLNEINIIVTAISIDPEVIPDILSIIAVSACIKISDIPFNGPVFSCRIGYVENDFILNPSYKNIKNSNLDLVISMTKNSIIMIESFSVFFTKENILKGIYFGYKFKDEVLFFIENFCKSINKNNNFIKNDYNTNYTYKIISILFSKNINNIYNIFNKEERKLKLIYLKKYIIYFLKKLVNNFNEIEIFKLLKILEKNIIRNKIINSKKRIDGRLFNEIRNIKSKVSILPRAHGSSLFTRGETQALVSVTLGGEKQSQYIEDILNDNGYYYDKFIFHYNFPSYCVGEIGSLGFPKRREIGHGRLAKKSIIPIIPDENNFPYTIRIVSEITESNGSSSMASVCGASLALMDAGVPIKSIISGIAMGLIIKNKQIIVLTDISGDEDSIGDVDFKISGNGKTITTIQMDVKSNYINLDIIKYILKKSEKPIKKIISLMKNTISIHRNDLSKLAPRVCYFKIDKKNIKDIIGKGGETIKKLIKDNQSEIDVNNEGIIKIISKNKININNIILKIKEITDNINIGKKYLGKIIKILPFGLLISIKNNKNGLIHISNLKKYNKNIDNFILNEKIFVKVINIDKNGKIDLIIH